jgi:hypothetical protein
LPTLPLRPLSSVSCACIWLGRVACTETPVILLTLCLGSGVWGQGPVGTGLCGLGLGCLAVELHKLRMLMVGQGRLYRTGSQVCIGL